MLGPEPPHHAPVLPHTDRRKEGWVEELNGMGYPCDVPGRSRAHSLPAPYLLPALSMQGSPGKGDGVIRTGCTPRLDCYAEMHWVGGNTREQKGIYCEGQRGLENRWESASLYISGEPETCSVPLEEARCKTLLMSHSVPCYMLLQCVGLRSGALSCSHPGFVPIVPPLPG